MAACRTGRGQSALTTAQGSATAGAGFSAVIADEHELYCVGLGSTLKHKLGCTAVLPARTFNQLNETLDQNPSVSLIIVDLSLPGLQAIPALGVLRSRFPAARLVVMASAVARETVLLTLSVGIHGFIPKRFQPAEIVEALQLIMTGYIFVPSSLADLPIVSEVKPSSIKVANGSELTAREREIMMMVGTGLSYKAIARQLDIAPGTVKVHVNKAFRTLGVRSKLAAISALEALERDSAQESEALIGRFAA